MYLQSQNAYEVNNKQTNKKPTRHTHMYYLFLEMVYGHPESHLHNQSPGNTASPKSDP